MYFKTKIKWIEHLQPFPIQTITQFWRRESYYDLMKKLSVLLVSFVELLCITMHMYRPSYRFVF